MSTANVQNAQLQTVSGRSAEVVDPYNNYKLLSKLRLRYYCLFFMHNLRRLSNIVYRGKNVSIHMHKTI